MSIRKNESGAVRLAGSNNAGVHHLDPVGIDWYLVRPRARLNPPRAEVAIDMPVTCRS